MTESNAAREDAPIDPSGKDRMTEWLRGRLLGGELPILMDECFIELTDEEEGDVSLSVQFLFDFFDDVE
jgi:hypothetical protein